jgi:hypothetical protein
VFEVKERTERKNRLQSSAIVQKTARISKKNGRSSIPPPRPARAAINKAAALL